MTKIHIVCLGWLRHLLPVRGKSPASFTHSVLQLGIEDPESCHCEEQGCLDDPCLRWLHEHHREWNAFVRDLLRRRGLLSVIRQVLTTDLQRQTAHWEELELVCTPRLQFQVEYVQGVRDGFCSAYPSWC